MRAIVRDGRGDWLLLGWAGRFVHNVIAHPLLMFCRPVGEWLHDRTEP